MVDDSVRDVLRKNKFEAVILTGTEVSPDMLRSYPGDEDGTPFLGR